MELEEVEVCTLWEGKDATAVATPAVLPLTNDGGGVSDSETIKRLIRERD